MKLIIAGGRDYSLTLDDLAKLDGLYETYKVTEVVSGCALGADYGGEQWALKRDLPVTKFPADWKRWGRAAGPIRNREMAAYADAVALFPGGAGTTSMHEQALNAGLLIFDFRG